MNECEVFERVASQVRIRRPRGRPRQRPVAWAGDKAYSSRAIRRWLRKHHIRPVIPERADQALHRHGRPPEFDRKLYRRRNVIERLVGWLKERRRLSTRYEKLAQTFRGMICLAFLERYFNALRAFRDAA